VGGHCIAVDPWFLADAAPQAARLIRAAREVNDGMPEHVLDCLAGLARPPAAIALLGITYKAEVDDVRESPALLVAQGAVERGYAVRLCDPHVSADTPGLPAPLLPIEQAVRDVDVVALLVDHAAFRELDIDLVAALVRSRRLFDARDALDHTVWRARGFVTRVLGSGTASLSPHAERTGA
ncbi:MAG: UDP-N-acetyl-D-mannosamine dehydrogenase, partial [Chloroflexota bacterium]|nr:UDP-N-acetyl-D-mannosamine dehydrogenase [Chloroflexota bacterium]